MRGTTTGAPSQTPRPRLLLVTHHYPPEHGAPQRRWDTLTPRIMAAGLDVAVLAPPPHYPTGRLQDDDARYRPGSITRGRHGERVVRVRFRPHSPRLLSRTLDQTIAAASSVWLGVRYFRRRGARPHVVIGTVPGIPSMFAAWALARLLRARLVVEMRDAWPDLIEPSGILDNDRPARARALSGLRAAAHRAVSRLQARADAVVTTTETFAQVLLERGIRRVTVVRNGTSFRPLDARDAADPARDETADRARDEARDEARELADRADVTAPRRPLRAVYAGTVGRAQDLECVVRAAALVARRGLPIDLRIVGTGSEVPALQRLAADLDAPVSFVGPVPHEQVRRLYSWADTVVVTLRDWKPLEWTVPSKLYEVMASGTYATACVAGEAAALVRRSGAGSVISPGDSDALADLWAGWAATEAVPDVEPLAARWVAENADDDVLAAKYVALLRELTGAVPTTPAGFVETSSVVSTSSTDEGEATR
ncbi:glycosyltransferase family 4 protein [Isoptericola hypogeus]|uniref:D-inositol 3-phosphate glycosyltransferase n=1 Tax=Isoptericola hypogeus TaxID=300179 RepID=A0ABN2JM71_9MICO